MLKQNVLTQSLLVCEWPRSGIMWVADHKEDIRTNGRIYGSIEMR